MKLGRKIHVLEAGSSRVLLIHPFRVVVGDEIFRLRAYPKRAHEDEAPDARLFRGCKETARAADHQPFELLGLSLPDRDEVNDDVDVPHAAAKRLGISEVALDSRLTPDARLPARAGRALEDAHFVAGIADGVCDSGPDEACGSRDEDTH